MTRTISLSITMLFLSVTMLSSLCVAQDQPVRRPRVAIGDFEYKGVMHLKDGTSSFVDMISTALMKTRQFDMVERSRVKEALKEMGLGEAGVVDPSDCQKLGTLLKADLILFGTITQASMDSKQVAVSGLTTTRQEIRMAVDIRIIDAKTGKVKTAETVSRKKVAAKQVNVSGVVATGGSTSGIVGDVMRDVANSVVAKMVSGIYPIMITLVRSNDTVKLNYGDPMVSIGTYKVYDADGFPVGQIKVTDVAGKVSFGKTVSGNVQVGMTCRKAAGAAKPAVKVQEIPF